MVQKRNCENCSGTGLVSIDFKYSIICHDCDGNGYQEISEKQSSHHTDEAILNLLHIVSQYTTSQQYEQIVSQFNEKKIGARK